MAKARTPKSGGVKNLVAEFQKLLSRIEVTWNGHEISFGVGCEKALEVITKHASMGSKLIFIGNGGSAAIASHQATDFYKNGGVKAVAFNDPSLLTCLSNDFSFVQVFEKAIEGHAEEGDVLVAISSSGKSANIINGVQMAKNKKCRVITLSGFDADNPLRREGEINFYVPSHRYSHVENLHLLVCHSLLDILMERK